MNLKGLKLIGSLTTAFLLVAVLTTACGGGKPQELAIPVKISGDKMDPNTIQVKQGDMVTLNIEVEAPGKFHLHTYDIEKDIGPDQVNEFFFIAKATGRFRITFHPTEDEGHEGSHEGEGHNDKEKNGEAEADDEDQEIDIGFLEVHPR